jgi:hypothetical protein
VREPPQSEFSAQKNVGSLVFVQYLFLQTKPAGHAWVFGWHVPSFSTVPSSQTQDGTPSFISHFVLFVSLHGFGEQLETHSPFMQASPAFGQVPCGFENEQAVSWQASLWHIPPFSPTLQTVPPKQSSSVEHFF